MSKGTTWATFWLLGGLLLSGIAGCGADDQSAIIAETNARLDDVITTFSKIQEQLKTAIKTSTDTNKLIAATDENLLQAVETAKDLRKLGERLQRIKEYSERAKDKTLPEYSKELLLKERPRLQDLIVKLEKEEKELRVVMAQVEERVDPEKQGLSELQDLKTELKNGRDAFELLTKTR